MKKFVLMPAFIAALCMISSCRKEIPAIDNAEDCGGVKMHTIAVTADFGSKTSIVSDGEGGFNFNWIKGDNIRIWEVVQGQDLASGISTIDETSGSAEFNVNVPERSASDYMYFGVYPGAYDINQNFRDLNGDEKFRIKLSTQQTIYKDSFDPNSDLLVSRVVPTKTQPDKLELQFGRIGGILKIRITGLNPEIPLESIRFTADCPISGYVLFDPLSETYSIDNYNMQETDNYGHPIPSNYVYLYNDQYSAPFDQDGQAFTTWLRAYPAQIKEFTVETIQRASPRAQTTTRTFRRVNVAAHDGANPVSIQDGKMTELTVSMGRFYPIESVAITGKPAKVVSGNKYQLSYSVTPLEASEDVSWSSSNTSIATINRFGILTAMSAGEVTITATAGSASDVYVVQVEETIPEAVDLALPSGVLWSSCNLGAGSPLGYGLCYPWGDPVPNDKTSMTNYKFCNYSLYKTDYLAGRMVKYTYDGAYASGGVPDNKRFLDPEDDPATSHLGDSWRSPTVAEFQELFAYCNVSRAVQDGVNYVKFTSKSNGNSIIVPLTGFNGNNNRGSEIRLWTCEQLASWDYPSSLLVEDTGVHTEISQNITTWSKARSSYASTHNKWAFGYRIDASSSTVSMTQLLHERYWVGYCVRPVKAAAPVSATPKLHIKSVEDLGSGNSLKITLERDAPETNYPSGSTTHTYYIGRAMAGSSEYSVCSEIILSNVTKNDKLVTGTLTGLSSGTEYSIYAVYKRKKTGTSTTETTYSDNRFRVTPHQDPSKMLTAFVTSPASLTMAKGTQADLVPAPTPATAPVTVTYQSYNPSIATVDYNTGHVTAVATGTTAIYCIAQGLNTVIYYNCPVTVMDTLDYGNQGSSGGDINDDNVNDGGSY